MPRRGDFNRADVYASNSSLTSSESAATVGSTYKKKKPAPQPPTAKELFPSDQQTSPVKSSNNVLSSHHVSNIRMLQVRVTRVLSLLKFSYHVTILNTLYFLLILYISVYLFIFQSSLSIFLSVFSQ